MSNSDRNCWLCGGALLWIDDYSCEDFYSDDSIHGSVSVLACIYCGAEILYIIREEEDDD